MCYETQMPPYKANSRGGHHRQNLGQDVKI
jgi:hypothetical protein